MVEPYPRPSHFGLSSSQCFPLYTYDEDGGNRRDNISDWALERFREEYNERPARFQKPGRSAGSSDGSARLEKEDIFYYTYALLHHPDYRERYAANLRRELPRLPLAPDFWGFAEAGRALANLHVNYEAQPRFPLELIENPDAAMSLRVEKMRLSKDGTRLRYNDFLTLAGIPAEAHQYRLGNRSAVEWLVDQYRTSTDARSGIHNDPNRADDPEYLLRLIGQIVTVSVETVRLVAGLPPLER